MARLFLGIDSSTQSLSAIVINLETRKVVYEKSLNFDAALPHYKTQNGTLRGDNPLIVHSPPQMWVEALDLMFATMKADGVALGQIQAIAGSGQQHGSVYLNRSAAQALASLNSAKNLKDNLAGIYARRTSPIWMDSSTTTECHEIRAALGGVKAVALATGSDAFERFTGPQIRKFAKQEPGNYEATASIALVSSFMAGILAGKIAPIDQGDGAGMNLMDIKSKTWNTRAVEATATGLLAKLPSLAESSRVIGPVSAYFVRKYGLNKDALALVWSGDNPCSVIGLGLIEDGMVAISLGTSDTLFGYMKHCRVDEHGEGHVFGAPTGDYMTLVCLKNGSLAREKIRDQFGLDWEKFNAALASTPPGNDGKLMFPWFDAEITPRVTKPGIRRVGLDVADAAGHCRAVVESQMLALRLHTQWMQVRPTRIYATGGASANAAILQVMADVMDCPVARIEVAKSAALGAALRAAQGWLAQAGKAPGWEKVVRGFTDPIPNSEIQPNRKAAKVYDKLLDKYASAEREALKS